MPKITFNQLIFKFLTSLTPNLGAMLSQWIQRPRCHSGSEGRAVLIDPRATQSQWIREPRPNKMVEGKPISVLFRGRRTFASAAREDGGIGGGGGGAR